MAALSGGPNGLKGGDWLTQGIFDVSHLVDGPERYGASTRFTRRTHRIAGRMLSLEVACIPVGRRPDETICSDHVERDSGRFGR